MSFPVTLTVGAMNAFAICSRTSTSGPPAA